MNEMESFYNIKITNSLHQKIKKLTGKDDMTKKDVHNLLKLYCDARTEDSYKIDQLVTLKRVGKI